MTLRPYQKEAFDAVVRDIKTPGNALIVMPTGSGKSHIIAEIAKFVGQVLILQPSRELLAQNMAKLGLITPPECIGIYSASFNERTIKKYTFATIQSVYKRPELFRHIRMVIMDEAHGLAPRSLDTMYMEFFRGMNSPKVLGLTATPFRLEIGYNVGPDGELDAITMLKLINRMRHKKAKEIFWKRIIYNIPHKKLVDEGYLVPIEYIHQPLIPYAEIPINKSHSDYNLEDYGQAIVGREALILSTISEAQKRYKSVLVFCSTTEQALTLSKTIIDSRVVLSGTDKKERNQIISDFKSGIIKTVFNVQTLTTGFDHPSLDCIILLRPTRSPVLYNQILGRLTRPSEGKTRGTVIDLTGACKALGRIETFELYRNDRGLWDLKTEKHPTWHNRTLFSRQVR